MRNRARRARGAIAVALLVGLMVAACTPVALAPTPTPSPALEPTATPTAEPPTSTPTPTPSPTPTATLAPTPTRTPTSTPEPTATPWIPPTVQAQEPERETEELPSYVWASQYPHESRITVNGVTILVGGTGGVTEKQAAILRKTTEQMAANPTVKQAMDEAGFDYIAGAEELGGGRTAEPSDFNGLSGMVLAQHIAALESANADEAYQSRLMLAHELHELARLKARKESGSWYNDALVKVIEKELCDAMITDPEERQQMYELFKYAY